MIKKANFSRCKQYRYLAEREWDTTKPTVLFIMLNPSTLDHKQDNPTIKRCLGFAQDLGFGNLLIANLFAYKATKPEELMLAHDPLGSRNMEYLRKARNQSDTIITAWGVPQAIKKLAPKKQFELINSWESYSLGYCKDGNPRHPLYLKKGSKLILNKEEFQI